MRKIGEKVKLKGNDKILIITEINESVFTATEVNKQDLTITDKDNNQKKLGELSLPVRSVYFTEQSIDSA